MISIVMPTHRKMPMLYATLISVFSQKYEDFEFIVIDASQDDYFEEELNRLFSENFILKSYKHKLDKLKIIHPEANRKFPGAMKMEGFRNCVQDDDFVVFLDHDDFIGSNLLGYMQLAKTQYPDTEMISTEYTSMIYTNGHIITNMATYAGGTTCSSTKTIYIGDMYFKFESGQDVYKNMHPYKAAMCPKIISKKVIRENRFKFIEDTEKMDDMLWPIMTHALVESYIPIIGYVYVAYSGEYATNSCTTALSLSDKTERYHDLTVDYEKLLDELGFVKSRNEVFI